MTRKTTSRSIRKWPYIFMAPFILTYLAFELYPTLYSLVISFTNWTSLNMTSYEFVGLDNYIAIFTSDTLFWKSIGNTIYLMALSIPLTVICGLIMATVMHNLTRGRQIIQTLNFLPYVTTPVAIGLIFAFIFSWNIGLVNNVLTSLGLINENINWIGSKTYVVYVVALMVIWRNFGYFMVLYLSGLSTISDDYYEAARVDGANVLQSFFKITLPLLRPVTVFVVINSMIGGLQLFDEAVQVIKGSGSTVVGGPERSVLTAVWYYYDVSFNNNSRYGYGAAVSFSIFLLIALVSFINVAILNRKED